MSMKMYLHYAITSQPWGGINSYFKAFKEYMNCKSDFKVVDKFDDNYDILLMGANAFGRTERIKYSDIEQVKRKGVKVIHRLDGLRSNYTKNEKFLREDNQQLELSNLADWLIFQSNSCYNEFKNKKALGSNFSIINNGVNQDIFNDKYLSRKRRKRSTLKVLSVSWSNNINKGFETIARMSEIPGVQSFFVGNWNKNVDLKKVKVISPLARGYLSNYYKDCDIFLHPAKGDPCPNVVIEALSSGLPVIYHNSGGTPELVRGCGLPIEESLSDTLSAINDNYDDFLKKLKDNKEYFSIKFSVDQYIKIFKQVLGRL